MNGWEDSLGNLSPVAVAAAQVASELHKGQKDKGGKDYFTSHLLVVGCHGHDWKEQTVGFLHDAAEDTPHSVEEVVNAVRRRLSGALPSDDEWNEIKDALNVLNHHNADSRTAYIQKIKQNRLALRVKLNDLRSNMDISRIPHPTSKDFLRLERYEKEYAELTKAMNEKMWRL